MQRRFTVAAFPRVRYFSIAGKPEVVYVSRAATVREFRAQLCTRYVIEN